ncbi:hypothetical protein [Corallococcus llansteffanensis]|uniref:Uncharacterized protein n=1 Tax=Corallococcus llansteffanensis TaxID=2316731 RepID=A0A3A8Q760_9BACT|nr:hypothetical protein [Corallococcus llansteffanensis]RKH64553.1 hypothetical protein D7V93_07225 [Corallococcus llansteffanensis]
MSEYQRYEFIALDRPLTPKQMAELRSISTRAEISPTRFWNEYQWGDLKADPAKLLARYFDAHLYFANWGTHRLMLRLPRARVDVKVLKGYFIGRHAARLTLAGEHVVLDFISQDEEPEDDEERQGSLAALTPLRAELLRGDLRSAYLAWLLAVQAGEVGDDAPEPPVPAGLAMLTAAQQAMVEFLRIDVDLLAAAARDSVKPDEGDDAFRRWVTRLPPARKDQWLLRAADAPDLALGGELLRTFRAEKGPGAASARRTVRELQALAETQQGMREKAEAARAKKARDAAGRRLQRKLDELGRDVDAAWVKLEKLVEASTYDEAVMLAVDLKELATRGDEFQDFAMRFEAMRKRQHRRRGFFDRWKYQGDIARW